MTNMQVNIDNDKYAMWIYYGKYARKCAKYVKFADHVENYAIQSHFKSYFGNCKQFKFK